MAISYLQAIILGIIQGITEWLPISSSGHLALAQHFLGIVQPVSFDIVLHLGSLVVVFIVFYKDIRKLVEGILKRDPYFLKYFGFLVLGSIPIAFVGLVFNDFIKGAFGDLRMIAFSFMLTAVILFASRFPKKKEKELNWKNVFIIGCGQALAILPGVSRSGTSISTGLMQGVERNQSARFAFLLFIPAILGASLLELNGIKELSGQWSELLLATLMTVLVGYMSLKLLLMIIKKQKFSYFAWYCLFLGISLLFLA